VQDPDGRRQVVVYGHDPAYWYFPLGEVPIKNGKRELMGPINEDKINNLWNGLP
jgi:hypothetical protein